MPKPEISSDRDSLMSDREEALADLERQLKEHANNGLLDSDAFDMSRRATEGVLNDIQATSHQHLLLMPSRANGAIELIRADLSGGQARYYANAEMGIDLTACAGGDPVMAAFFRSAWEAQAAKAAPLLLPPDPVPPQPQPQPPTQRGCNVLGAVGFCGLIFGLILLTFSKQIFPSNHRLQLAGDNGFVPAGILEAEQNYLSLMMQAAADNPVNFSDFGISQETYALMRKAILMTRDNISEENHWQMQADQSKLIYPPTKKPLTLGDHLVSLDLLIEMLKPLYPIQPSDLDIDQAISTLAGMLDLEAETPMNTIYQNVMEVAPDRTGINRLQRVVLVRWAIVRAVAQSVAA